MDMDDFADDGFPKLPNGNAYERSEIRTGPPLEYVAQKLHESLRSLHRTVRAIERYVPDTLPPTEGTDGAALPAKYDFLASPAQSAFHYALVAYLALNNMLGAMNNDLVGLLLTKSDTAFDAWLRRVAEEGSVTG